MMYSWAYVQTLGVGAASGAGVPPAQALAFGAMLARHLADNGAEAPIVTALNAPEIIVALALRIERVIEAASLGEVPVCLTEENAGQRALLISWLFGLPCQSDLKVNGGAIAVSLQLSAPSQRARPDRVALSPHLKSRLQESASKAHLPDGDTARAIGTGAGQMGLD